MTERIGLWVTGPLGSVRTEPPRQRKDGSGEWSPTLITIECPPYPIRVSCGAEDAALVLNGAVRGQMVSLQVYGKVTSEKYVNYYLQRPSTGQR